MHDKPEFTCEVVLGLANVHPVAWEGESIEPLVTRYEGEDLLLDGGRPQLNAVQHSWAQHVDAGIDRVPDKDLFQKK